MKADPKRLLQELQARDEIADLQVALYKARDAQNLAEQERIGRRLTALSFIVKNCQAERSGVKRPDMQLPALIDWLKGFVAP